MCLAIGVFAGTSRALYSRYRSSLGTNLSTYLGSHVSSLFSRFASTFLIHPALFAWGALPLTSTGTSTSTSQQWAASRHVPSKGLGSTAAVTNRIEGREKKRVKKRKEQQKRRLFVWARSCRGAGGDRRPVWAGLNVGHAGIPKVPWELGQIKPLLTIIVGKVCLNGDRRAPGSIPSNYHLIQGRRQRITDGLGGLSMGPAVWHEYMKTSDVGRGQTIHDTCWCTVARIIACAIKNVSKFIIRLCRVIHLTVRYRRHVSQRAAKA